MLVETRVSRIQIDKNSKYYSSLDYLSHQANNIYNSANYVVRQSLFKDEKLLFYSDIDKYFKEAQRKNQTNLYRKVQVQFAQQIYRNLEKNWKSWYKSRADYNKNPNKYSGKPKPPKYKDSGGRSVFYFSNQMFKVEGSKLIFTKLTKQGKFKKNTPRWRRELNGLGIDRNIKGKVLQIRVVPKNNYFILEVVYEEEVKELVKDNGRYISIDPGMNNLLTIASNVEGFVPYIVNGRPIKSINQFYNKRVSELKSLAKQGHNLYNTNQIDRLSRKRTNKIDDYFHKASNDFVNQVISYGISKVVIGSGGTKTKDSINLGKRTNQNFVQIPFSRIIEMVTYKCRSVGVEVILVEESYTSQSSFLDGELPIRENGDKARHEKGLPRRRIKRGLYLSDSGEFINADLNGSYQIMKKVFPNAYADGIVGVVLHPVKKTY